MKSTKRSINQSDHQFPKNDRNLLDRGLDGQVLVMLLLGVVVVVAGCLSRDLAEAPFEAPVGRDNVLGQVLLGNDHGLEAGFGADLILLFLEEAHGGLMQMMGNKR